MNKNNDQRSRGTGKGSENGKRKKSVRQHSAFLEMVLIYRGT